MRLAWVTGRPARGRDLDEPLALAALGARGVQVDVVEWDDPTVDWGGFDRVLLRSTWDYPERVDEFVDWIERIDPLTDVRNPLSALRWSMDKHYLAALDAAGVPVVPTRFVEVGERPEFPAATSGFVVKPAVGAGSRDVVRYPPGASAAAERQIADLHRAGRAVLVQPVLPSIVDVGEWPMVYLGGDFSHAASKFVVLPEHGSTDDLFAAERNRPAPATPAMRAVADAAIEHVHAVVGRTTYARVDLVLGGDGRPVVLEVELVEPSLFVPEHPPAADRLAAVITS